jgi:hypothetical protein
MEIRSLGEALMLEPFQSLLAPHNPISASEPGLLLESFQSLILEASYGLQEAFE